MARSVWWNGWTRPMAVAFFAAAASLSFISAREQSPAIERVYPLAPDEGVFAYARISPDGRHLAYASEMPQENGRGITQTVTVVDLSTKKVVFEEPGIDAYFSTDGRRMIFLSYRGGGHSVVIRDHSTGEVTRNVAPTSLGDYFSWAERDGRNLILTINSNYYNLDGDRAVLPAGRVPSCDGIGRGERPLISRDGMRITTFVRGTVVVRNLMDCRYVFDTGIGGAKADFSWDGRYIAFHAPKERGSGYEINIVDLRDRTVRTIDGLAGSSFFPSWTRDGRLSFRYDGDDYHGFVMASNVLAARPKPLPARPEHVPDARAWSDLFPETPSPRHAVSLVMVWSPWVAHVPTALQDLERARDEFARRGLDVGIYTATDPASRPEDVTALIDRYGVDLRRIALARERVPLTEAHNQIPAVLLFRGTELIDRRLGAQTLDALRAWVMGSGLSF